MKFFAIVLLVVALLASIAFSVPAGYESCKDIISISKPKDGIVYKINSTQILEFEVNKYCYNEYGMY